MEEDPVCTCGIEHQVFTCDCSCNKFHLDATKRLICSQCHADFDAQKILDSTISIKH